MTQYNSSLLSQINSDDKLLINRIEDMIKRSDEQYMPVFSFFLDERQQEIVKIVLFENACHTFRFFGGYSDAKRKVLCIYPEFCEISDEEFPIIPLTLKHREADKISHRDVLGSLMGLLIKRETIGDILITDSSEDYLLVYDSISRSVLNELSKVGRVGVKCTKGINAENIPAQKYETINGFVSSLRLDSCVSLAIKVSREKAANIITSIGVEVNYLLIQSKSQMLNIGDVFSIRGYGKFILSDINGTSKKGRFHIAIKKYV